MKTLIALTTSVFLGGLLIFLVADLVADKEASMPKEFSLTHPTLSAINLTDHDNQPLTLGDLKGKTVVLNFMFNGCSPVQTVALRRAYLDHKLDQTDKNITFLSVSVATETDTPEQLKQFAQRYNIYSDNWRLAITDKASLDILLETLDAGIPPEAGRIGHLNTIFLLNEKGELSERYKGYPVSPSLIFDDLANTLSVTPIS